MNSHSVTQGMVFTAPVFFCAFAEIFFTINSIQLN